MSTRSNYEQARSGAQGIIQNLITLTDNYAKFTESRGYIVSETLPNLKQETLKRIERELSSSLLNVAVCGAFSAGKSFLISGLLNRVLWTQTPGEYSNEVVDRFSSLLPSKPEQTSSCPLEVVCDSSEEHSRLEVLFQDSAGDLWEDRTEPYSSEDEIQRKLMVYATTLRDFQDLRPEADKYRTVRKVRLYVNSFDLPAVIHDLPGIGGEGDPYQTTVQECLQQADCIIYVASAMKELDADELRLLREVEEISRLSSCPVFFVLSQTDREPEWERVITRDNDYLKQYFPRLDGQDRHTLEANFLPVSPAGEAKARGKRATITEGEYQVAVDRSGMPALRRKLREYLESNSGPLHLTQLLASMAQSLHLLQQDASSLHRSLSLPIARKTAEIDALTKQKTSLVEEGRVLATELDDLATIAIRRTFLHNDAHQLAEAWRLGLAETIKKLDLTKKSNQHRLEREACSIRDLWLQREQIGVFDSWNRELTDFLQQTIERCTTALVSAEDASAYLRENEATEVLNKPQPNSSLRNLPDTIRTAAAGVAVVTGAVGGFAGAVTIVGTVIAVTPASLALAVVGVLGFGWSRIQKRAQREEVRKEILDGLDASATQVLEAYKSAASRRLSVIRVEVSRHFDGRIANFDTQIAALEQSLLGTQQSQQEGLETLVQIQAGCSNNLVETERLQRILAPAKSGASQTQSQVARDTNDTNETPIRSFIRSRMQRKPRH